VAVVLMENHEYGQIIGSPSAPYVNSLASTYGLATSSYGITHPSLPNYLALTGGSTFGISSDCTSCHVGRSNLVDQLERHGISWKAYMEDLPSPCYTGSYHRDYAKKHDPFVYYDDVVRNPSRCHRVVPFTQLSADLRSGTLPRFVWVTPNLCHDMHDCGVATGDDWLKANLPPLLAALGPTGVLFLTFDEGTSDAGCCGKAAGGHVATIVAGPAVVPDGEFSTGYDHYSVLRTIEAAWGLGRLRNAGCSCTRAMSAFFA
jgi:acid phosphatase